MEVGEVVKYYFADFVRQGGTPPPLYGFYSRQKRSYGFGGYLRPPFTDICLLKKHLILVQKIGYGFGGYPPPPFTDKIFGEKGVTDLGVPPSPPLRIFFQRKGGYGFGGSPPPPLRTKSAK